MFYLGSMVKAVWNLLNASFVEKFLNIYLRPFSNLQWSAPAYILPLIFFHALQVKDHCQRLGGNLNEASIEEKLFATTFPYCTTVAQLWTFLESKWSVT